MSKSFKSLVVTSALDYVEHFENYLKLKEEAGSEKEDEITHDWEVFFGNLKRHQSEFHIEMDKLKFLGEDERVQRQTLEYLKTIFVKMAE